eukprot:COSAG06_NODE_6755_length_2796_cov_24.075302_1_plen_338_part_10
MAAPLVCNVETVECLAMPAGLLDEGISAEQFIDGIATGIALDAYPTCFGEHLAAFGSRDCVGISCSLACERAALLAFQESGINTWSNWVRGGNPCEDDWGRNVVTCDNSTVTRLDLHGDFSRQVPQSGFHDVVELAPLQHLKWLSLTGNFITGSLSDLSSLTMLTNLAIYNNDNSVFSGDLRDLRSMPLLESIELCDWGRNIGHNPGALTGDVADLQVLTYLRSAKLCGEGVTGDIQSLMGLSSLTSFYCAAPGRTGDCCTNLRPGGEQGDCDSSGVTGWPLIKTSYCADFATLRHCDNSCAQHDNSCDNSCDFYLCSANQFDFTCSFGPEFPWGSC